MKLAVFFITGACGTGKSTLTHYLKDHLPRAEVHDFDEGVPDGADREWRKQRTSDWLEKAKFYQKEGKATVICGLSVPKEVRKSPAYSKTLDAHFGIIHVAEEEIRRRLVARGWKGKQLEDNIRFAEGLEAHVKTERGHHIVDGKTNSPSQVAKEFVTWILKEID
jgi:broad-specificity NMP kinase